MRKYLGFIVGAVLSVVLIAFADSQEVSTGDIVICATAADARNYAATHRDRIQTAIDNEADDKSCLVAKIAFVPGKESDRLQQQDATYIVTEILVVAVSTPYGYLSIRPSPAYTLLKLGDKRA